MWEDLEKDHTPIFVRTILLQHITNAYIQKKLRIVINGVGQMEAYESRIFVLMMKNKESLDIHNSPF